jgi:hypothetical protein
VRPHGDARQIRERNPVGRDHDSPGRHRRGRDDKVVRASRSTLPPDRDQQVCVGFRGVQVVREHRNRRQDVVEERLAVAAPPARRQLDPDAQLGDRHGSEGDVVVVLDELVEAAVRPFCVDEERGVEQQAVQ